MKKLTKYQYPSRFTLIINDDSGEVSLEMQDHLTKTKIEITAKELKNATTLGIGGLSKMIIKIAKEQYRTILSK